MQLAEHPWKTRLTIASVFPASFGAQGASVSLSFRTSMPSTENTFNPGFAIRTGQRASGLSAIPTGRPLRPFATMRFAEPLSLPGSSEIPGLEAAWLLANDARPISVLSGVKLAELSRESGFSVACCRVTVRVAADIAPFRAGLITGVLFAEDTWFTLLVKISRGIATWDAA